MDKNLINSLFKNFEQIRQEEEGKEFWFARDLQILLGYTDWRNFSKVLEKAKLACFKAKQNLSLHFVDVNKTSQMPKGGEKELKDYKLSRYACYLVAQNGDPKKEEIAFAQTYFAVQTRKQEIIEEQIQNLERLGARKKVSSFSFLEIKKSVGKLIQTSSA